MRIISAQQIKNTVARLCLEANLNLRKDVLRQLKLAYKRETSQRAKDILLAIIKNAEIARKEKLAICQDTGLPVVFVKMGQGIKITGDLKTAITQGIVLGYKKGYFRQSIIENPFLRGKSGYAGRVIHFDLVGGTRLEITVLPKGFGCENKSALKMFLPTVSLAEIKRFIIETVKAAGPDACPPYVVGVGIGGTADYASFLAKKALLRKIGTSHFCVGNLYHTRKSVVRLEKELLVEINKLNIGPMGLGGKTTALAVNIETAPTHIAGLAVGVNISCHALRSASAVI